MSKDREFLSELDALIAKVEATSKDRPDCSGAGIRRVLGGLVLARSNLQHEITMQELWAHEMSIPYYGG